MSQTPAQETTIDMEAVREMIRCAVVNVGNIPKLGYAVGGQIVRVQLREALLMLGEDPAVIDALEEG